MDRVIRLFFATTAPNLFINAKGVTFSKNTYYTTNQTHHLITPPHMCVCPKPRPGFPTTGTCVIQKSMPPPLPYFKVNICPFPLPHLASIFFAYLWSFRWPNYIVTLPSYFSFRLPHLNIPTGPPQTNWTRIFSERHLVYFSVIETDTATSGLRWIFHMHSEFSRPAMCNNAIMIISSQM